MSKIETEFETFFRQKKLSFKRNDRKLKGTPDFQFQKGKINIVLFLHGCYWHGHNCKEWNLSNIGESKQAVVISKDLEVRRYYMRDSEYLYLRVWECEYLENKYYQLNKVFDLISSS